MFRGYGLLVPLSLLVVSLYLLEKIDHLAAIEGPVA